VTVYFPGEGDIWYDVETWEVASHHGSKKFPVTKSKVLIMVTNDLYNFISLQHCIAKLQILRKIIIAMKSK
jgi:hypothetical protein